MFLGHAGFYRRVVAVAITSVAVFAVGYLVYLPFHANFELFSDGIELSRFQTPLWRYVLIHSLFLFAIFSWMFVEWRRGAFGIASLMRATRSVPRVSILDAARARHGARRACSDSRRAIGRLHHGDAGDVRCWLPWCDGGVGILGEASCPSLHCHRRDFGGRGSCC